MLFQLFDLGVNVSHVIKVGLMLMLSCFHHESIDLLLSLFQEGGCDHVRVVFGLGHRLLEGGNFS